jgi:hypothetical protein
LLKKYHKTVSTTSKEIKKRKINDYAKVSFENEFPLQKMVVLKFLYCRDVACYVSKRPSFYETITKNQGALKKGHFLALKERHIKAQGKYKKNISPVRVLHK